jgi:hypothetical protein
MPTYQSASANYSFVTEYASNIEVLYAYSETDPFVEYTTVSYRYTDGVDGTKNVVGCRAAATQDILNNLPDWMAMRDKHDSVGQDLVHSWGCNLEDARTLFNEYRRDQFLSTAETYFDIHAGMSELSFNEEKVYSADLRNILFNSSFSMRGYARAQKPEGWSVRRDALDNLTFSEEQAIFGRNAVRMVDSVEIKQTRELAVAGGQITFSTYVKTESDTGESVTTKFDPGEAGLVLVLSYADGTIVSYGVGFPKNTKQEWVRAGLTVNMTKELVSFEAIILNRTSTAMFVHLPMLEGAKRIQSWSPSFEDVPIYLRTPFKSVTGAQVVSTAQDNANPHRIELLEVASEEEFQDVMVPTRITPYAPKENAGQSVNSALGRQVNAFEETHPVQWTVVDGKIKEKSLTAGDVFGTVQPRDLYKDEAGDLFLDVSLSDSDLVVKAVTAIGRHLLVVTWESYAGKDAYYLKVVRPQKVQYEDTFLESVSDLEIPINLNTFGLGAATEDITRIGVCKYLPGVIFIDTTLERRFYYQLKFDYYYADFNVRKLFCRESYLDNNAHLQVI